MTIAERVKQFSVGKIVTYIEVDFTTTINYSALGPSHIRICNAVDADGTAATFNGYDWDLVDFEFSGVASDHTGKIPEPELRVHGLYQSLRDAYIVFEDLRDAVVKRHRYFVSESDYITDTYYLDRIERFSRTEAVFKLSIARGLADLNSPATRLLPSGLCVRKYRRWNGSAFEYTDVQEGGCPWGQWHVPDEANRGTPYYDASNNVVADPALDKCPKTHTACIKRFDPNANANVPVPFTGTLKVGTKTTTGGC